MKKLILLVASLVALAANAATTVPVQLLNPTGSTAGQAIVSTGASSAPAWGPVSATSLAAIASNSVLANVTGSTASPTAFAMPSCSTANSALQYTTSTGFTCYASSATLGANTYSGNQTISSMSAPLFIMNDTSGVNGQQVRFEQSSVLNWSVGVTSTNTAFQIGRYSSGTLVDDPLAISTSTGLVTFADGISPSQTAGITGTTTNNNANAGSVGEYMSVGPTTSTGITSTTPTSIGSLSLTAGDWDVECTIQFTAAASSSFNTAITGVSTSNSAFGSIGTFGQFGVTFNTAGPASIVSPVVRESLSATTPVYCMGQVNIVTGTVTTIGFMRARRVR